MSRFEPGQVWTYHTRPGEEESRLTIVKVEPHDKLGTIVHIQVNGIAQKPPPARGLNSVIHHMPFAEEAIGRSVIELAASDAPVPPLPLRRVTAWGKKHLTKGKVVCLL